MRTLFAAAVAAALLALPAHAAEMYLQIKAAKQGEIRGDVTRKGAEGRIAVIDAGHAIVSPRDAASGQATGKRQHKPLTITKAIDRSTPLIFQALATNENLPEVILEIWGAPAGGPKTASSISSVRFASIKLVNATVAESEVKIKAGSSTPEQEVSFVYQKIIWTWDAGGVTTEIDALGAPTR